MYQEKNLETDELSPIKPLEIMDDRGLQYLQRQINELNWIASQTPDSETRLIAKMSFAIRVSKKDNKNRIGFLIELGLLKKINDTIDTTEDFHNYVKEAIRYIKDYLKKRKQNEESK